MTEEFGHKQRMAASFRLLSSSPASRSAEPVKDDGLYGHILVYTPREAHTQDWITYIDVHKKLRIPKKNGVGEIKYA